MNYRISLVPAFIVVALLSSCDSGDSDDPSGTGGQAQGSGGAPPHSGGAQSQGSGGADPGSCEGLDEKACEARRLCAPIFGYQLVEGTTSPDVDFDTQEFLGCRYNGPDAPLCTTNLPCAHSPSDPDTCRIFTSGCLPSGWESIQCDEACMTPGEGGAGGAGSAGNTP